MDAVESGRVDESLSDRGSSNSRNRWHLCGRRLPKTEIVFFCQVVLIYIVVVTCIINLTLNVGKSHLWTSLLSGCLGYLLPNPNLSSVEKKRTVDDERSTT